MSNYKVINFSHHYYKLDDREFTTIRGKSKFSQFKIGEIVKITLEKNYFCFVEITDKVISKINAIPFDLLKLDASYGDHIIDSLEEFISIMNSFRIGYMPKVDENSEVTIFRLKKTQLTCLFGDNQIRYYHTEKKEVVEDSVFKTDPYECKTCKNWFDPGRPKDGICPFCGSTKIEWFDLWR